MSYQALQFLDYCLCARSQLKSGHAWQPVSSSLPRKPYVRRIQLTDSMALRNLKADTRADEAHRQRMNYYIYLCALYSVVHHTSLKWLRAGPES